MQQPLDRLLTLSALPNRTPDEEVELQRLAHQTPNGCRWQWQSRSSRPCPIAAGSW